MYRFLSVVIALLLLSPVVVAQQPAEPAQFHHVRLNVTDRAKTYAFYKKYFHAIEVDNYRGDVPVLFTERSFIIANEVDEPPLSGPKTAISHIGWAAVTGVDEYEWLKSQGVEFQTELGQLGNNYGMYVYGPDRELAELWTGSKNHRFEHVHLWATDVAEMASWFQKHLGLSPRTMPKPQLQDKENIGAIWMSFTQVDNVNLVIFGRPDFESVWWPGSNYTDADGPQDGFLPTKGSVIDHIAFSYRDIEPVYERMKANGADVQGPIAVDPVAKHKSFYVLAPDNLLIEIVEARPIPDASWETD